MVEVNRKCYGVTLPKVKLEETPKGEKKDWQGSELETRGRERKNVSDETIRVSSRDTTPGYCSIVQVGERIWGLKRWVYQIFVEFKLYRLWLD